MVKKWVPFCYQMQNGYTVQYTVLINIPEDADRPTEEELMVAGNKCLTLDARYPLPTNSLIN